MNRAIIFDAVREMLGRGFNQNEVDALDNAITLATAGGVSGAQESGAARTRSITNPEAFFAGVRKVTGSLDQQQVDIIHALLKAAPTWGVGWMAYALATAWHEARLKPIEEWGRGKGKKYGAVNSTGKAPYGRGLVQLTWDANYKTMDEALGLGGRLAKDYALALDPEIAVRILVVGMQRGLFTGKSLGTYIGTGRGTVAEFKNARRIINGTDRDDEIAELAVKFQDALAAGGWG